MLDLGVRRAKPAIVEQIVLSVGSITMPASPSSSLDQQSAHWSDRIRRIRAALARLAWTLLSIGFFVGLWELGWYFGWANPRLFPPPHLFLGTFLDQAQYFSPALRWQVGVGDMEPPNPIAAVLLTILSTSGRVAAGLLLASLFSVILGAGIRRYIVIERLTLPTILFLAPISPIAWLPVAVFLFGIGNAPAIFMVFVALFFTMTIATVSAIDGVNKNFINAARIMGATRGQIYRRVIIPAIAPGLLFALRMNLFAAWMVVLLAEATGVGRGLGQIVMLARNTFNPSLVFFTISIIGILGFLSDWGLRAFQNRYLFWGPGGASGSRA
jgi:NitT/TauT family transport system permease protein